MGGRMQNHACAVDAGLHTSHAQEMNGVLCAVQASDEPHAQPATLSEEDAMRCGRTPSEEEDGSQLTLHALIAEMILPPAQPSPERRTA